MDIVNQILENHLLSLVPPLVRNLLLFYMLCKVIDFGTGGLKVWKNPQDFKSRIMRDGIIRWIGEIAAIIFVIAIDFILGLNFYLTIFTLGLFIVKEGGSIDENFKAIGVDLPSIIFEKLNFITKGGGK